jgi:hypothetical protein
MNDQVNPFVLRRLEAAQSFRGRFLLSVHLALIKLRSQWLAHGGDVLKRAFDIVISVLLLILLPVFDPDWRGCVG